MIALVLKREVSIGELLTAASILLSVASLLVAFRKDRDLKRKQYADRIRLAASATVGSLERRKKLTMHYFDRIQPVITRADMMLVETEKVIATRDELWCDLVECRATTVEGMMTEHTEIAYMDLYAYDSDVRSLFLSTMEAIELIDRDIYSRTLQSTQESVMQFTNGHPPFKSAVLGNSLRRTAEALARECELRMEEALLPFREEMIRLTNSSDGEIFYHRVTLGTTKHDR